MRRTRYQKRRRRRSAFSFLLSHPPTHLPTHPPTDGVPFFLLLVPESYWQVPALNALSVWLSMDVKRVESVLIRPSSIESLVVRHPTTHPPTYYCSKVHLNPLFLALSTY